MSCLVFSLVLYSLDLSCNMDHSYRPSLRSIEQGLTVFSAWIFLLLFFCAPFSSLVLDFILWSFTEASWKSFAWYTLEQTLLYLHHLIQLHVNRLSLLHIHLLLHHGKPGKSEDLITRKKATRTIATDSVILITFLLAQLTGACLTIWPLKKTLFLSQILR